MKLNFFKKKKTGWELDDLLNSLQEKQADLIEYSKDYPLSALSPSQDRFVIIRKFAAREFEGKIDMLNASDVEGGNHYPISQSGMTLVSISDFGASSHNVILPNSLTYERVELTGETISIHHSKGITTTNFKELDSLWTIEGLEEEEILNRFNSLTNFIEEPQEIKKFTESTLHDSFFGQLTLNRLLDSFEVTMNDIEFSFANTTLEQLSLNLRKTEQLIRSLQEISDLMTADMLKLKNKNWLEDGEDELSKNEFQKEISILGININEDGGVDIYYNANDLFSGHEIETTLDHEHHYEGSKIIG